MSVFRMTPEQLADYNRDRDKKMTATRQAPSKYRNKRTEVDGITFCSKKEADRYLQLSILQKSGSISGLCLQVPFRIDVNGVRVCNYVADFVYTQGGSEVVEDVKGMKTSVYSLKRKLMKAVHGITIKET